MKMANWELPEEFLPAIRKQCTKSDIEFYCTPFDIDAVDTLTPFVDAFKIGSYEILCLDMIRACADTKKPLIISTGVIKNRLELDIVLSIIFKCNSRIDLTVLECDSHYPAKPQDANLNRIYQPHHRAIGEHKSGWSDHTVEPGVIHGAVAMGAEVIEFHLDPFDDGLESSVGHCWDLKKAEQMISDVRIHQMAIGQDSANFIAASVESDKELLNQRTDPRDYSRPLLKGE
jgi:N-acetylneuraminate synthase